MGYSIARDFAEHTDLDTALYWHFTTNMYPPLPTSLVEPAKQAIQFVAGDEPDELVELPEGISHRLYGTKVPAHECVDGWRLDAFVDAAREK